MEIANPLHLQLLRNKFYLSSAAHMKQVSYISLSSQNYISYQPFPLPVSWWWCCPVVTL